MKIGYVLACLQLGLLLASGGCGKRDSRVENLAALMPDYVSIAESVTSILSVELGNITSPPTPGALAERSCMRSSCRIDDDEVAGTQALFYKQALGCSTSFGARDGSIFMRPRGVPEFIGCSTRRGPFVFGSWPPSSGEITFSTGIQAYFTETVDDSPPSTTLDHIESGKRMIRNWGSATLSFNGTTRLGVVFEHWAQLLHGRPPSGDPNASRFQFSSIPGLTLRLDSPWDTAPRVFNGSFKLLDHDRNVEAMVHLGNVTYEKEKCCHPVTGRLTVTSRLGADPDDGVSVYVLSFSHKCGEATLIDSLGHGEPITLPGCAG